MLVKPYMLSMVNSKFKIFILTLFTVIVLGCVGSFRPNKIGVCQERVELYKFLPRSVTWFCELHALDKFASFDFLGSKEDKSLFSFVLAKSKESDHENLYCLVSATHSFSEEHLVYYFPVCTSSSDLLQLLLAQATVNTPPKNFTYRGYEIQIYAFSSGQFIAFAKVGEAYVMSYQMHKVEEVIDAHLDETQLGDSKFIQRYNEQRDSTATGLVGINSLALLMGRDSALSVEQFSDQEWVLANLFTRDEELEARVKTVVDSDSLSCFQSNILLPFPEEGFAYYHWLPHEIVQMYDRSQSDTLMTPKEQVCNEAFYEFLERANLSGLSGFRVKDSVISSDLLIAFSMPDAKKIQADFLRIFEQKSWFIHSLLRDEGIYQFGSITPYPAPRFLNVLTGMSRDQRIIYTYFTENHFFITWNEDLLNRYLEQLQEENTVQNKIQKYCLEQQEAVLTLFSADMGAVFQDTLTTYNELPTLLLLHASALKDYVVLKSYVQKEGLYHLSFQFHKK